MKMVRDICIVLILLTAAFTAFNSPAAILYSNECWISTNATGNLPSNGLGGSLDNPYDGSTQANFDSCMHDLTFPGLKGAVIHILPGTYKTHGNAAWKISKSNLRIVGSGKDITILKMIDDTLGQLITTEAGAILTNTEVSDLTLDGNYISVNDRGGIGLDGTHNAIRRVKLINCGSSGDGHEGFGLVLSNFQLGDSDGNVIEDCEVSNCGSNNTDFRALGIVSAYTNDISGTVRNNHVYGGGLDSTKRTTGFIGGTHDILIEGNFFKDVTCGWYNEEATTNVLFVHNRIINSGSAVFLRIGNRNNLTFAFNSIILTNISFSGNVGFCFEPSYGSFPVCTNVTILGNSVIFFGNNPIDFIDAYNITGLNISHNTVDSRLTSAYGNCLNINIDHNYDLSGNDLSWFNVPVTEHAIPGLLDYFVAGAGNATMTGFGNTGTGLSALAYDTTGCWNTANGVGALLYNTTGNNNTAVGRDALKENTSGSYNVAIGMEALSNNVTGDANIAIGVDTLQRNTTGSDNTATGNGAMRANITGSRNTAYGAFVFESNTNGVNNTAYGDRALDQNTSGNDNIAVGFQAGYNLTVGSSNIVIGNVGIAGDNNIIRIGTPGIQTTTYIAGTINGDGGGLTNLAQKFVSIEYPLTNVSYSISTNHGLSVTPQSVRWVLVCKTAELGYSVGDEVSAEALVASADNSRHVVEGANATKVFFAYAGAGNAMQLPNKTSPAAPQTLTSASSVISNWKLKCYASYTP